MAGHFQPSQTLLHPNVDHVQLDSLVLMKIVNHFENERQSSSGALVRGYLTGLILPEERRLEVTNCFPTSKTQGDEEEDQTRQLEQAQDMLRRFRQMNVDYQLLGFYESAPFSSCFTEHMVESMFDYQSEVEDSVVLIYDPVKTCQGVVCLKAYRLSLAAMDRCYNDFSPESVKQAGLTFENLFEELPITIKNSHLLSVLLAEINFLRAPQQKPPFLDLGQGGSLEKCLRELMGHIDLLNSEVTRYNKYMVNKQKQDALRESLIQKKHLENESRRARGEPPQPMDEMLKSLKTTAPPTMLDGMLAAAEVNAHLQHALQTAGQNLGKLFITEAVVEDRVLKDRSSSSVTSSDRH